MSNINEVWAPIRSKFLNTSYLKSTAYLLKPLHTEINGSACKTWQTIFPVIRACCSAGLIRAQSSFFFPLALHSYVQLTLVPSRGTYIEGVRLIGSENECGRRVQSTHNWPGHQYMRRTWTSLAFIHLCWCLPIFPLLDKKVLRTGNARKDSTMRHPIQYHFDD